MSAAVSVITPSHDPRYLEECQVSLLAQTRTDWEWIVVLNGGAQWVPSVADDRIRLIRSERSMGVGEAKALACEWVRSPFIVELDHDDLLLSTALERIVEAFDHDPSAVFVYSGWAQILEDGSPDTTEFSAAHGWRYRSALVDGVRRKHAIAMEPTPHNVSYIWYAPNHVRAFRTSAYRLAGGYDRTLHVLDDQDLMCRLYRLGSFRRIDECLYLQRIHSANTHREQSVNAHIQEATVALYDRYFESNALAWSTRNGLRSIEVAAAEPVSECEIRHTGVSAPNRALDVLNELRQTPDSSVGVVRFTNTLSFFPDGVELFNEVHRALAPDGACIIVNPSADGRGGFQHPRAVSFYNENSFWYYTEEEHAKWIPELTARFQVSRSVTIAPDEWHEVRHIQYLFVNLIAVGAGSARNGGPLLI